MNYKEHEIEPTPWFSLSRSAFWKVAGILVIVQVLTGLITVLITAWLAYGRSLSLVEKTIQVRLNELASEVENRAFLVGGGDENATSLLDLPESLLIDLTTRFPDPVTLIDRDGKDIRTIQPNPAEFDRRLEPSPLFTRLPAGLLDSLRTRNITINMQSSVENAEFSWAATPIFNQQDELIGGLLVQPLTNSIDRELAGGNRPYIATLFFMVGLSGFTAVLLGAFLTWQLVSPLRDVMQQVERIGSGDFAARVKIDTSRGDEFARLAAAINQMAGQVDNNVGALRATDKLRRQMIANFGHDLRTPLAALLGYLEEAQRHLVSGQREEANEALGTAERQGKYLQQLIGDLFELSLLDNAQAPLRSEPIPIAELLNDAANGHRPAFKKADISFEVSLPAALPMIEGDGVRLLRVLDNLMSNARNHTPQGGRIELRASQEDGQILIQVEDSGSGMEPEVLKHIFDRYYTGTDARTRRRGTGLGLPISWAIARAHGGTLTAESVPGEGSVFTLTLPLNIPEPALEAQTK